MHSTYVKKPSSIRWFCLFIACLSFTAWPQDNIAENWSAGQLDSWHYLIEELEIQELHQRFSQQHQPASFALQHVTLIPMTRELSIPDQTVIVSGGRITAIGASDFMTIPDGLPVIDGSGQFLMPGLTDMHVHNLDSHSQHLLNLTHGVTSVRDMDGFLWMLRMREAINENRLLAPTMYVSGTILNGSDFGGYAQVAESEQRARELVHGQAQLGYDFIKVHNSLSFEILKAIAQEADLQGLDMVGHIPVGVTVAQAVGLGMRTFEHFKGYIIDSTLTLSEEDYVSSTRGAAAWNTPTFTNYRNQLRGQQAAQLLARESEMQYVSPRLKRQWVSFEQQSTDRVTELRQNIYPMSRKIFTELRQLKNARFLAGTDSGSYEMMPPGFVLHEEIHIFQNLGMSPFEALQTATVNPAHAMRKDGDFGVIAVGAKADLLLLTDNPLLDAHNSLSINGIAAHGSWLSKSDIDGLLLDLKNIFSASGVRLDNKVVTRQQIDAFLTRTKALAAAGFVFRDHHLELAAGMFESLAQPAAATAIRQLKTEVDFGFDFLQF